MFRSLFSFQPYARHKRAVELVVTSPPYADYNDYCGYYCNRVIDIVAHARAKAQHADVSAHAARVRGYARARLHAARVRGYARARLHAARVRGLRPRTVTRCARSRLRPCTVTRCARSRVTRAHGYTLRAFAVTP